MTKFRVVHVSDTHLSPTHAYFAMNWAAFRDEIAAAPPDLVVHGGDMAFNAPVVEEDLAFAARELAALGVPWRAIPGNHDIGEVPKFARLGQPITPDLIAAWHRQVGAQYWVYDIGAWRLVGLDTALMGSGLPEEAAQMDFFRATLADRAGRPVMVFIHMPPFDRSAKETAATTSYIPFAARGAFLDRCVANGVKAICCGHMHVYRSHVHRGMEIVWAPPTAMVGVQRGLAKWQRFPRPGYVEWTLDETRATHRLVEPARMFVIDMTGWSAANPAGTVTTLPPWRS